MSQQEQPLLFASFPISDVVRRQVGPIDYNEWVRQMEHDGEARRLESDALVYQSNGKPFKSRTSAEKFQQEYSLNFSHEVSSLVNGFVLKRLSPAAQADVRRIAEGRESWIEAQTAVLYEMNIESTNDGEIQATEDQWLEIERRTKHRLDLQTL
jgi:hypothetical protein